MSDKITVIIAAYNAAAFIARCLDSVVNQTYRNLEILIVYKDSADTTLEKIAEYRDSRIQIIRQECNSGPGGARNLGLRHATGEYIGFVESDDCVSLDYYMKLYADIVGESAHIAVAETIFPTRKRRIFLKQHKICTDFYSAYASISHGGSFDKLYSAEILKINEVSFQENIRWEDNFFTLSAFFYSKKIVFTKGAYYYYYPSDNAVKSFNLMKEDALKAMDAMLLFATKNFFPRRNYLLVVTQILTHFLLSYYIKDRFMRKKINRKINISASEFLMACVKIALEQFKRLL